MIDQKRYGDKVIETTAISLDDATGTRVNKSNPLPIEIIAGGAVAMELLQLPINMTAAGDTIVVPAQAGKTIRAYRLILVTSASTAITIKSPTAITGPLPMVANGSIILDGEALPWFVGGLGQALVINSSNAVNVTGFIGYTVA